MDKHWYTVAASTAPVDELDDATIEAFAKALTKSRILKGGVASGNMLSRTLALRASVEAVNMGAATIAVFEDFGRIIRSVGSPVDVVDLNVMRELADDEFASSRDDIVGTPEVAERLGVSRQRIAQLVEQMGRFPSPAATVRGTHVWRWGDIADWVAAGARDMRRRSQADNPTDLMATAGRLTASAGHSGARAAKRKRAS